MFFPDSFRFEGNNKLQGKLWENVYSVNFDSSLIPAEEWGGAWLKAAEQTEWGYSGHYTSESWFHFIAIVVVQLVKLKNYSKYDTYGENTMDFSFLVWHFVCTL